MRALTVLDRDEITDLRRRGEFFWLDLREPGDADLTAVGELFGLNDLARRQLRRPRQRAKLLLYGEHALLVFWGMSTGAGKEAVVSVRFVISGDGIVTVRDGECPSLDDLRQEFQIAGVAPEQFILYRILDALTDAFFPVLERIDDQIDVLEDAVLAQPTDEQLGQIAELKRELVGLRRIIEPERDIFSRAGEDFKKIPGLQPASRDYFRDLYDHLIRLTDEIDAYRDLLSGAMDVYLSTVSNRLNLVMERLTIVATIFLPLTLLTGFFGMNFGWLVREIHHPWTFWVFGVGGSLLSSLAILAWIRQNRLT